MQDRGDTLNSFVQWPTQVPFHQGSVGQASGQGLASGAHQSLVGSASLIERLAEIDAHETRGPGHQDHGTEDRKPQGHGPLIHMPFF